MIEGTTSRVNPKPILVAALIAVSFSTIAWGAPPPKHHAPAITRSLRVPRTGVFTASPGADPARNPDLQVVIDPATGLLLPPGSARARSIVRETGPASSNGNTTPVMVFTLPDGTKMASLGGRFTSYMVSLRDSTGRSHVRCVQGAPRVRRFFEGGRVVDALGARR